MGFELDIDVSPVYELLVSFYLYTSKQHHKSVDLGPNWAKQIRRSMSSETVQVFDELQRQPFPHLFQGIELVVYQSPCKDSVDDFMRWLGRQSATNLYDQLAPFQDPDRPELVSRLGEKQQQWMTVLTHWNAAYFQSVEAKVMESLYLAADEMKHMAATMSARDVIQKATNGLRIAAAPTIRKAVLVPQHHFAPWNVIERFGCMRMNLYPVDIPSDDPHAPPKSLQRMVKALSDDSRMRILNFLAAGPQTFMDIVRASNLTKGTVHHHLVALRAAGLVWLNMDAPDGPDTYEINSTRIDEVSSELRQYLFQPRGV